MPSKIKAKKIKRIVPPSKFAPVHIDPYAGLKNLASQLDKMFPLEKK